MLCKFVKKHIQGVHFSNIGDPVTASSPLSMADIFAVLIFDALFYFILACYIDLVRPGKWGIGRPWYFPFQISFWKEIFGIRAPTRPMSPLGIDLNRNKNCEPVKFGQPGFRLENIVKEFKMKDKKEKRRVVDKLSFQVTLKKFGLNFCQLFTIIVLTVFFYIRRLMVKSRSFLVIMGLENLRL